MRPGPHPHPPHCGPMHPANPWTLGANMEHALNANWQPLMDPRRPPPPPGVPIQWPWHSHSFHIWLVFSFAPLAGIREDEWLPAKGNKIKISIFCFLQQYSGVGQWFKYSRQWRILAALVSVKWHWRGSNHKMQEKKEIVSEDAFYLYMHWWDK